MECMKSKQVGCDKTLLEPWKISHPKGIFSWDKVERELVIRFLWCSKEGSTLGIHVCFNSVTMTTKTMFYLRRKCANQVITLRQHLNIKQNSMKWRVWVTGTKPCWFGNFLITNKFIVFVSGKKKKNSKYIRKIFQNKTTGCINVAAELYGHFAKTKWGLIIIMRWPH